MIRFIFLVVISLLSCSINAGPLITKISESFELAGSKIYTVDSEILERKYDLYVKLPKNYSEDNTKNEIYPVIYLNDGPHTFKVASGVTHFEDMDKAIIVGISFAHGENGQFSRVRDLTPMVDTGWKRYTTGGAKEYLKFIEKEVIPFIEGIFRVDPTRRILSGHSLGGSFGAWVLLTKPQLFSSYILTSPSLWFKDEMIFDLEDKYASHNNSLAVNVYIATGALETTKKGRMRNDMVDGHKRFFARLQSRNYRGLKLNGEIVNGTDHFSTFPVGLAKGLRWIYHDMWAGS
ncbi:histidine kinase [Microbulbifer sp. A4B17]|uniref:alpha/beta hydrolase n=1 Tax=Microbulbifer sp. A4B17 TaxID=359370 RepID=UPI000D52C679|nr:alpha/beta hydrolase-fold protein [Microbulbifer sp. A4B17]AWF82083.1 histidine kinase [Microbulbifer sp. A4B17]